MTLTTPVTASFAMRRPYAAIMLITLLLFVALGAAGTALFLFGKHNDAAGTVVQQVQPTLLVFPFIALWLGVLFTQGSWRVVSPRPLHLLMAHHWALLLVPLLIVIINVFDARPSLARDAGQLAYFIAFCALVAFVEEGLYRGLFMRWLLPKGVPTSVLVSTLAFSLTHVLNLLGGQSLENTAVQLVFAFLFGLVAALVRLRVGSLLPLMLWHFLFDFASFTGTNAIPNLRLEALSCLALAGYATWLSVADGPQANVGKSKA